MKPGQQDESSACCQGTKPEPKPHRLLQAGFLVPGRPPTSPALCPQTQTSSGTALLSEMPAHTGDLARADQPGDGLRWVSPLPRSKGSCASSSEARLSLELPCITLPSMQRSTGRRASTALWVSRAGHQGCQGTQTPRHGMHRDCSRWHLAEGARSSLGHSAPHAGLGSSPSPGISKPPRPGPGSNTGATESS